MDNGTEVMPNYSVPENVIGVDENYLSRLTAEADQLGSSFPLCSELLARGMLTFFISSFWSITLSIYARLPLY